MTAPIHDDNFHEIQLNGKQLVFLFMAATVVSVVIFLSGVMVGRGVRAERLAAAAETDALAEPTADAVTPSPADPPPAAIDLTKVDAPPTAGDSNAPAPIDTAAKEADEIRPDRPAPKQPAPVPDKQPVQMASAAKSQPVTPAVAAKPSATREPAAPPAPVTAKPAARASSAPAAAPAEGGAFAVQVAALNNRGEADGIAKRLTSKGYAAYVQVPAGTNSVFRVRVGSYKTRREAEAMATRLQKEEHVKPWVTR